MKKKLMTIGLFGALFLIAGAKTANAYDCSNFYITCAGGTQHTGYVCGNNEQEKFAQLSIWGDLLCNESDAND
jgi:hypothetical protein